MWLVLVWQAISEHKTELLITLVLIAGHAVFFSSNVALYLRKISLQWVDFIVYH